MAEWITSGQVASPQSRHDVTGGDLTAGPYEWQVRTADALGEWGPWSTSSFFSAATPPPGPIITSPANGETIGQRYAVVQWSTPDQDANELQRLVDGVLVQELGPTYNTSRSVSFGQLDNNTTQTFRVRTQFDGLWSAWAEVTVTVSYTPPAVPTIEVDDTSDPAAILVRGTVAPPGVGEPDVTHLEVWRREGSDTGPGIRRATDLAPSQVFTDHFVASGVEYFYRLQAFGSNETASWSEWSGESTPIYDELDGGSPAETGDTIYDGGPI